MTWGPTDVTGLTTLDGGVTAANGFRAGGVAAGLKPSGAADLAVVLADQPAAAAAVTTTNRVKAAPCLVTEEHVADGQASAVLINAGSANACTGPRGLEDARWCAAALAAELGTEAGQVLVMSTGVIGVPLPMDRLATGIPLAVRDATADGGPRAARAIITTDTRPKEIAYRVADHQGSCTIGGMVKGAGMIEPAMATMLAVITTDAPLSAAVLRPLLKRAVEQSFNRISVDACGSTNDTVVVLANGTAATPPGVETFQRGLERVCADLARMLVEDGEGTTRVAEVTMTGARDAEDARRLARAVTGSALFRAALHGGDPNWGRILAAMGATDVEFDPDRVSVSCGGVNVCRFGVPTAFDRGQASAAMSKPYVEILVDAGTGHRGTATMLTSDLSREYVTINADYTT